MCPYNEFVPDPISFLSALTSSVNKGCFHINVVLNFKVNEQYHRIQYTAIACEMGQKLCTNRCRFLLQREVYIIFQPNHVSVTYHPLYDHLKSIVSARNSELQGTHIFFPKTFHSTKNWSKINSFDKSSSTTDNLSLLSYRICFFLSLNYGIDLFSKNKYVSIGDCFFILAKFVSTLLKCGKFGLQVIKKDNSCFVMVFLTVQHKSIAFREKGINWTSLVPVN